MHTPHTPQRRLARATMAVIAALALGIAQAPAINADPAPATEHRPGSRSDEVHVPADVTIDGKAHPCADKNLLYGAHIDATYITRHQGKLAIMTVDGTEVVPSESSCMRLAPFGHNGKEVSRMVVPDDPALSFLGKPGTILWHAPFTYYLGHIPIWAGFGAFDQHHEWKVPNDFVGNGIDLELVDFSGPGDMEIFNYISGWKTPRRHFSSRTQKKTTIDVGGHGHYDWTFSKPGIYALTWQATGRHYDGTIERSEPTTQYWLVGTDEQVHLPKGTTRGLTSISYTAEDARKDMGLKAPSDDPVPTPQPKDIPPTADTEAIQRQADNAFYEEDPDGIISRGTATANLSWSEGSQKPTLTNTSVDPTDNFGSYPVLEIPDSTVTCVDPADPYLGSWVRDTGSRAMYLSPARATNGAPSFGVDTTGIDYDALESGSKASLSVAFEGPVGGYYIGGIDNGQGFIPVAKNGGGSNRSFMFPEKGVYPTQYGFSTPGVYTATPTFRVEKQENTFMSAGTEWVFLVGNEAINAWRKKNGQSEMLPTGGDRSCGDRTISGANPFYYPQLPGVEDQPLPEPEPTVAPEPQPEPKPEPAPSSTKKEEPAPKPDPKPEPAPSSTKKEEPAPKPDPKPEPAPSSTKKEEPAPKPDPKPEPAPSSTKKEQPAPKPDPKPEPAPSSTKKEQPAPKPDPKPEPQPAPTITQPAPQPAPSPSAAQQDFLALWGSQTPDAVITQGHMDLALIDDPQSANKKTVLIDDAIPSAQQLRPSGSFVILVPEKTRGEMPPAIVNYANDFAGEGWYLPQVQDSGLPWVGFSTDRSDYSSINGEGVTVSLKEFTGPGRMITGHMDFLGKFTPGLDSANSSAVIRYQTGSHDHQYFLFNKPGAYRAVLNYSWTDVNGTSHSEPLEVFFAVGRHHDKAARELVAAGGLPPTAPNPTQPSVVVPAPEDPAVPEDPAAPTPTAVRPGAPVTPGVPSQPTLRPTATVAPTQPAPSKAQGIRPVETQTTTSSVVKAPDSSASSSSDGDSWSMSAVSGLLSVVVALVKVINTVSAQFGNLLAHLLELVGLGPAAKNVVVTATATAAPVTVNAAPGGGGGQEPTPEGQRSNGSISVPVSSGSSLSRPAAAVAGPAPAPAATVETQGAQEGKPAVIPLAATSESAAQALPLTPVDGQEAPAALAAPHNQASEKELESIRNASNSSYMEGVLVGVGVMAMLGAVLIVGSTLYSTRRR
ncbi:choice-of-anchor M domain-containing protein [Corynebacterium aquilae]|uniref:choice-of-anchor M domain-containing protein n=1 Tax=Corynebacterium aquilae TaxID=203263 RepID=UPI0009531122|nr:choice-of-anchor M domain-containing protein [Corynebacterium aquilae]